MKAHLVQLDIAWENPSANFAKVDQLVQSAAVDKGDLILLPEMFDSGFSFDVFKNSDTGSTIEFLKNLSQRTGCIVHGHRTVMLPDGKARNRATVVSPQHELLCEYDKIHLFSFIGENDHLAPGTSLQSYPWNSVTVCPAICYDLRFPELFRAAVQSGATVFALGSCWPAARAHHRRALAIARAIENQSYVLICNRCGTDPPPGRLAYDGHSMVIDPQGEIIAEARDAECVLSATVDPAAIAAWRTKFPALRDIRFPINPRPAT